MAVRSLNEIGCDSRAGRHERLPWSRTKRIKTIAATLALALLIPISGFALSTALLMARARHSLPSSLDIVRYRPAEATTVYSSDGVLLASFQMGDRRIVPLTQISKHMID